MTTGWRRFFYRWPVEFAPRSECRRWQFWQAAGICLLWLLAVLMATLAAYAGTGM